MAKKTTTFKFDDSEVKFHILTAFRLYSTEMYIAQKGQLMKRIVCDKCKHINDRSIDDLFGDYQSANSISLLLETVQVFHPVLHKSLSNNVTEAITQIMEYLTGQKLKAKDIGAEGIIPNKKPIDPSKPPKSLLDAIQMKDVKNNDGIIISKTMPTSGEKRTGRFISKPDESKKNGKQ